ncbi:MAG: hypothetical protein EOP11_12010 [Proteobacteria bacterium]|nr:MAG: hypothetical protein EOP11_12010 [Pseudomonadota bacterium]
MHLITLTGLVFCLVAALPHYGAKNALQVSEEMKDRQVGRQLLLEAMDKLSRYQGYYAEVNGRFTRDLSRLSMPAQLGSGTWEELRRDYEISVLEVHPNRFLLLATGVNNSDRVTIDESFRLNANFVLPPPSRAYLVEEADRLLRLKQEGIEPKEGVFTRFWSLTPEEGAGLVAVGQRPPVMGERRTLEARREVASLFSAVGNQVKDTMGFDPSVSGPAENSEGAKTSAGYKENLESKDVTEWLQAAQLAQLSHRRELGRYAKRWEDLDRVSSYRFGDRMRVARNVRVHPIELSGQGKRSAYRLTLEGTTGDLMGEQFVIDDTGTMRQVRYTESLIQQLQSNTNLLENFQINPIVDDPAQKYRP